VLAAAAPPPPPLTCPGLAAGVCTVPCQRATCGALAAFFKHSFNASMPWDKPETWMVTQRTPCSTLIPAAAPANAAPPYCKWYGVTCCAPAAVAAGECAGVHAVANITMKADTVNGSYSNPELMGAVEQLHVCGLHVLNLDSNDMSGELTARWGRLTNFTVLNLGGVRGRPVGGANAAGLVGGRGLHRRHGRGLCGKLAQQPLQGGRGCWPALGGI
jgi:hypothetical protein